GKAWSPCVAHSHSAGCYCLSAEIKCWENQRIRPNPLRDLPISFILLICRRQSRTIQIEELSAIKTDSLRAVGCDCIDVLWKLDVGRKYNVAPIACGGACLAQLSQLRHDSDSF